MARAKRNICCEGYYHIINRGNDINRMLFNTHYDYQNFLDLLANAESKFSADLIAYCIMPNHVHLLLNASENNGISNYMQWLLTSHVRHHHKINGTRGHLWQDRFKSFIIEAACIPRVVRYVISNPVRVSLVARAEDWQWSNCTAICAAPQALQLGSAEEWLDYVNSQIPTEELEQLRTCVNRQQPYGSKKWVHEICQLYGLESTVNHRGRPRKREM